MRIPAMEASGCPAVTSPFTPGTAGRYASRPAGGVSRCCSVSARTGATPTNRAPHSRTEPIPLVFFTVNLLLARGRLVADRVAVPAGIGAAAQQAGLAVDDDAVHCAYGPLSHRLDVMAHGPELVQHVKGDTRLDPDGGPAQLPAEARGLDGALDVQAEVEELGDELRLGLPDGRTAGRAQHHQGHPVPGDHDRCHVRARSLAAFDKGQARRVQLKP